jgi:hypothetical protein
MFRPLKEDRRRSIRSASGKTARRRITRRGIQYKVDRLSQPYGLAARRSRSLYSWCGKLMEDAIVISRQGIHDDEQDGGGGGHCRALGRHTPKNGTLKCPGLSFRLITVSSFLLRSQKLQNILNRGRPTHLHPPLAQPSGFRCAEPPGREPLLGPVGPGADARSHCAEAPVRGP